MTLTARTETDVIDPRTLVRPGLYRRLVNSTASRNAYPAEYADRVMSQALAFLAACAINRSQQLTPSESVDAGWHTFLTYTQDYDAFCKQLGGFIHHIPDDETEDGDALARDPRRLEATVEAIRSAGFEIDAGLWVTSGNCSQCHAGCTSSPKAGLPR